jgi:hypothetical protein
VPTPGTTDLARARARREKGYAQLAEQLHAVRSGALLSAEVVERAWCAQVAALRAVLLASPTTHADKIYRAATTEGLVGMEQALRELAHEALRELASS